MNILKTKTAVILSLSLLGISFSLTGCHKEDALTPSEDETRREPLQGNEEYDARIWDWYNKTGVVIRYRFNEEEPYILHEKYLHFHSDTTLYINSYYSLRADTVSVRNDSIVIGQEIFKIGKEDTRVLSGMNIFNTVRDISIEDGIVHRLEYIYKMTDGIEVEPAEEAYIGKQLDLLEKVCLNFLPAGFKPHTIFLGKNLKKISGGSMGNPIEKYVNWYYENFILILSCGDSTVLDVDETGLRNDVLADILKNIDTPMFSSIKFANYPRNYSTGYVTNEAVDIKEQYIRMIMSTPYATLIQEPAESDLTFQKGNYTGCLHPKKDTNGLIRQAYEAITGDFKAVGIDLQAIGDSQ